VRCACGVRPAHLSNARWRQRVSAVLNWQPPYFRPPLTLSGMPTFEGGTLLSLLISDRLASKSSLSGAARAHEVPS
jgi:hypothetical protein